MERMTPYVAVGMVVLLGCDTTPATTRAAPPETAAADTTVEAAADTTVEAAAEPPGRGFRMNGKQIVADTFEVRHQLRDGRLTLVLDTDLGDATEVFVSVARPYRERGNSEEYIVEYYNEAGTVGMWRSGKTIDLTSTDFWAEIGKLQGAMAAAGEPFEVASVSDELKVDFHVYPGQKPPFDKANLNLTGMAVSTSNGNRVIEKDLLVRFPLDGSGAAQGAR